MQNATMPQPSESKEESFSWNLSLTDLVETERLARHLATFLGAGDLVTLGGGLGVGKTTFARALIRAILGDATIEVPSPTFTLMQIYEGERFPLVHADLFRL